MNQTCLNRSNWERKWEALQAVATLTATQSSLTMRNQSAPLSTTARASFLCQKQHPAPSMTTTTLQPEVGGHHGTYSGFFSSRFYGPPLQEKTQRNKSAAPDTYQETHQPDNRCGSCQSTIATAPSPDTFTAWDQKLVEIRECLTNKESVPQSLLHEMPSPLIHNKHGHTSNSLRESKPSWRKDDGPCHGKLTKTVISDSNTRVKTPQNASPKQHQQADRRVVEHDYKDHAFQPHAFAELCYSVESARPPNSFHGLNAYGVEGPMTMLSSDAANVDVPTCERYSIPFPLFDSSSRIVFPERVYRMLHETSRDERLESIVSWQPHGRCFLVRKPKEFVSNVLPRYFRGQHKMTSFQRQLNLYGFKRISQGRDHGAYYHELFLRGRPFLCRLIARTQVKGNRVKPIPNPETEPDFYKMRPCLEEDRFGPAQHGIGIAAPPSASMTCTTRFLNSSNMNPPCKESMMHTPEMINHQMALTNLPGILPGSAQHLADIHKAFPTVTWNNDSDTPGKWPTQQRFLPQYPEKDPKFGSQNDSRGPLLLKLPEYRGMYSPTNEVHFSSQDVYNQVPFLRRPNNSSSGQSSCFISDAERIALFSNQSIPDDYLECYVSGVAKHSPHSVAQRGFFTVQITEKQEEGDNSDEDPLLDGDIASVDSSMVEIEEDHEI